MVDAPPSPQHLVALLRRSLQPDGLEGVVNAAAVKLPNLLHHVAARSVGDVRRAELGSHGQLGLHRGDGDGP